MDKDIPKEKIWKGKEYEWRVSSANHEPVLINMGNAHENNKKIYAKAKEYAKKVQKKFLK